jgi:hypothetical protein
LGSDRQWEGLIRERSEVEQKRIEIRVKKLLAICGKSEPFDPDLLHELAQRDGIRRLKRRSETLILDIVLTLFPDAIHQGEDYQLRLRRSEARVSTNEHFDAYFRFARPLGYLPLARVESIITSLMLPSHQDVGEVARVGSSIVESAFAKIEPTMSTESLASLQLGLLDRAATLSSEELNGVLQNLPAIAGTLANRAELSEDLAYVFGTSLEEIMRSAGQRRAEPTEDALSSSATVGNDLLLFLRALPLTVCIYFADRWVRRESFSELIGEAGQLDSAVLGASLALDDLDKAADVLKQPFSELSDRFWRAKRLVTAAGPRVPSGMSRISGFLDALATSGDQGVETALALIGGACRGRRRS